MTLTAVRTGQVRPTPLRLIVGYAAIIGTLPYLALKFAWIGGGQVGIVDHDLAADSSMLALNLFTAFMDLVAIALALVFTHSWGQRVPAWLLLLPIWVGTGFLAPIVLGAPVLGVVLLMEDGGAAAMTMNDPLADWVRPVVYGSFIWQGLTLLTAFMLYCRARWPELFAARVPVLAWNGIWRAIGAVGALLAVFAGGVTLAWAFGWSIGLPAEVAAAWTPSGGVVHGMHALMAVLVLVGLALLVRGAGRFRLPLVLGWTGAGGLFAWGFWGALNTVASTALAGPEIIPLAISTAVAQLLAGALVALVLLRAAREVLARPSGAAAPVPGVR